MKIKKVLKNLLSQRCLKPCVTLFLILFTGMFSLISAQNITVTGIVKDKEGIPIPGVTVSIKGESTGVITDSEGKFSIPVDPKKQIQISFIGFETQVVSPVEGVPLTIVLTEGLKELDEVVIMGYGGQQKVKNATFAVQNIDLKRIEDLPATNLSTLLRDQIPGLSVTGGEGRPGEFASLSIRQNFGFSKDGSSAVPLIVIDDVPQVDLSTGLATLGAFNALDVSEVESITVLKDAAAAIYGARAAQGAIIVRTKRGKTGAPRITYSGKFTTEDAISHAKTMDAYEYGLFANSFLRAKNTTLPQYLYSDDELEKMKSLDYDWLAKAWRPAESYQHSLNISGGTENVTYYTGGSYVNQGANMGSIDYKRWNFRSGVEATVAKNFKLSVSLSAAKSDKENSFSKILGTLSDGSYGARANSDADYMELLHMPRYIPYEYELSDGNTYYVSPSIGPDRNTASPNTNRQIAAWNYFAMDNSGSKSISSSGSYNANFSLQYDVPFIKGLSVRGSYALSFSSSQNESIQDAYTLARYKNSNALGTHLYGDNTITNWAIASVNTSSRVTYGDNQSKSSQANAYLNYFGKFGLHEITAMGSIERSDNSGRDATQLYNSPVSPYAGTSATAGTLDASNSTVGRNEAGTLSYIGRITYAYADKYLANFIIRSDASVKFAPEHYWGTFPSASFGWVPSEENFLKNNVKWLSFLKFRFSIGLTGRDNLKTRKWMQLYNWDGSKGYQFGTTGGYYSNALIPGASPNRDATWDKDLKKDLGIDASFLNNRFSVTYDYYYDRNYDMLKSRAVEVGTPISVGGTVAEENFAAVNAWGQELSISWHDNIGQVFYNIGISTGFGYGNIIKKFVTVPMQYPANNTEREGTSTKDYMPDWGYKVWKGTSTGDGILRTNQDINNYWAYLSANALAAGTVPKYFSITNPSSFKKGMLAYQDLGGEMNPDGTQKGPNGQIVDVQDYGKLTKHSNGFGFSTRIGASWKDFSISSNINTSWGELRMIDRVGQKNSTDFMIWSHEPFWKDMYDEGATTVDASGKTYYNHANVNGKYPNIGLDNVLDDSDFWQLPSFRCYISTLTVAYALPKKLIAKAGIGSVRLNLTGNNLWDLYNPFPGKYRNMYDDASSGYPTLRTWTLGVTVVF